jgi:hypothetical protein
MPPVNQGADPSPNTKFVDALMLGFPVSRTVKDQFLLLLSNPTYLYLGIPRDIPQQSR